MMMIKSSSLSTLGEKLRKAVKLLCKHLHQVHQSILKSINYTTSEKSLKPHGLSTYGKVSQLQHKQMKKSGQSSEIYANQVKWSVKLNKCKLSKVVSQIKQIKV